MYTFSPFTKLFPFTSLGIETVLAPTVATVIDIKKQTASKIPSVFFIFNSNIILYIFY